VIVNVEVYISKDKIHSITIEDFEYLKKEYEKIDDGYLSLVASGDTQVPIIKYVNGEPIEIGAEIPNCYSLKQALEQTKDVLERIKHAYQNIVFRIFPELRIVYDYAHIGETLFYIRFRVAHWN